MVDVVDPESSLKLMDRYNPTIITNLFKPTTAQHSPDEGRVTVTVTVEQVKSVLVFGQRRMPFFPFYALFLVGLCSCSKEKQRNMSGKKEKTELF